jgi:GNAT superfamily N-acetyltransferase
MPDRPPIPLTPTAISPDSEEFLAISGWPFADPFVSRLLRDDIPLRVRLGNGQVWIYRDPDGRLVGFGTLDVCDDYRAYTDGQFHPYIPLLAVNPTIPSRGYGTSIVRHLIGEAALLARQTAGCAGVLFLDVYTTSLKAIKVYTECGFVSITEQPLPDPQEDDKPYIVMAKWVSAA